MEDARPLAFVVTELADSVPPPAVTANATVIPDNASPSWSRTSTTNGLSREVLTVSVWLLPDMRTTVVATNAAAATTIVKVLDDAIPSASVPV